ncbi:hypothetical protein AVEN_118570-1 [Araneus ventricosus]|uniref:Uncharacterized protein n=1 Tax=Araneus ventricosus TaxID=182803 RepID=A0A4Y2AVS1_ARAVE|nr:hypothetical protein AVEN_118570-1 [Araneus ventricosus]
MILLGQSIAYVITYMEYPRNYNLLYNGHQRPCQDLSRRRYAPSSEMWPSKPHAHCYTLRSDLSDCYGTPELGDKIGDHFGDLPTTLATLATNR